MQLWRDVAGGALVRKIMGIEAQVYGGLGRAGPRALYLVDDAVDILVPLGCARGGGVRLVCWDGNGNYRFSMAEGIETPPVLVVVHLAGNGLSDAGPFWERMP